MDFVEYNRKSWDAEVEKGCIWTIPVSKEVIEKAKKGVWNVVLTPTKFVPKDWFPSSLVNKKILCLASGGGQQGPIFAATGAEVTVLDNSPKQLEQDKFVAERDNLTIRTELGDMRDLSRFENEYFDLVFCCANNFIDDVRKLWKEIYRVVKKNGILLAGFSNSLEYIFDLRAMNSGQLIVKNKIPYSDINDLGENDLKELLIDKNEPLCFGHSLEDQIKGQIDAGFLITGFYEDIGCKLLDPYINTFCVTKSIKINI